MKTKSIFLIVFILVFCSTINAQNELEKWLKKEQQDLEEFLSKEDKEFMEFLKNEWKEFEMSQGVTFYKKPKPLTPPVYTPPQDEEIRNEEKSRLIEEFPDARDQEDPEEKIMPEKSGKKTLNFEAEEIPITDKGGLLIDPVKNPVVIDLDFYGVNKEVKISKDLKIKLNDDPDGESISEFWGEMASKNFADFLIQTNYYKEQMNLNDWGYCLLLNNLANHIYDDAKNEKNLFIWFMLNKSGYIAKVGLIDDDVYLFLATSNKLYGVPYFTTENKYERLYVVDFDNFGASVSGSLYTYEEDYEGAENLVDMNVYKPVQIDDKLDHKTLTFSFRGTEYTVPVKINHSNIIFYENYPYSNLDIYFNAAVNRETYLSLVESFENILKGKSKAVAANILLRFAQTAFTYQADLPNFGKEKPLFIEETIYYNKSDCEDRSILFSFLVKNLLKLDVIAITYPGHCATAVNFGENVDGDYIKYKGKKYVICDPTYINADVGMTMTKYRSVKIDEIYELNH
jgi:hypothetical protein